MEIIINNCGNLYMVSFKKDGMDHGTEDLLAGIYTCVYSSLTRVWYTNERDLQAWADECLKDIKQQQDDPEGLKEWDGVRADVKPLGCYRIKAAHLGGSYEGDPMGGSAFWAYEDAEAEAKRLANEAGITYEIDEFDDRGLMVSNTMIEPEQDDDDE